MTRVEVSVPVRAPAAQVWDAMVDWERQSEWMLGTTVRSVGPVRRAPGDRMEAFTGVGPLGFLDTIVVTDWVEGVEVTVHHTGRVVRGYGTFRVEATGPDASVMVLIESLDIPGGRLGRLGWLLIGPVSRWGIRHSLRRFARDIEADVRASGRAPVA